MPIDQSTEYRMSQIARRLVVLLRRSNNPRREMQDAAQRLSRAELAEISVSPGMSPEKFAAEMENSENLQQAVQDSGIEFHPQLIESVDELVGRLIPSDGHLD